MKLHLIFIFLLWITTACSTLPDEQCTQPDWEHIGRIDGRNGIESKKYREHIKACGLRESEETHALYMKSWNQSISEFCTPDNGYKTGMMALSSGEACDPKIFPEFTVQFSLGRTVSQLRDERQQIRDQIEEKEAQQSSLQQLATTFLGIDAHRNLRQKDDELTEKIDLLQSNAPPYLNGLNETQIMIREYGSDMQNYSGAVVGSMFGFGIGHAIQGRYKQDGWKWTLGEVGTLGFIVATTTDCQTTTVNGQQDTQCKGNGTAILTWLAFRVWQGYSLFHYANAKSNIYALPTTNGIVIGYTF